MLPSFLPTTERGHGKCSLAPLVGGCASRGRDCLGPTWVQAWKERPGDQLAPLRTLHSTVHVCEHSAAATELQPISHVNCPVHVAFAKLSGHPPSWEGGGGKRNGGFHSIVPFCLPPPRRAETGRRPGQSDKLRPPGLFGANAWPGLDDGIDAADPSGDPASWQPSSSFLGRCSRNHPQSQCLQFNSPAPSSPIHGNTRGHESNEMQ
jgi:hypothetical protein